MERLIKIGEIKPKHAKDIKSSKLGLGFEKLDRDVFDPSKAYDRVAETGVKWARIQSGWAKTETEKGVYDFKWLDEIVDNLISRSVEPWLCLCYGNDLYTEEAKNTFRGVGWAPISTEEERTAWHNYCVAVVKHYTGKIKYFEVWNEPDGKWCWKSGPDGELYGKFAAATARAVKEGNPDALVIGGSVCIRPDLHFVDSALKYMAKDIDLFSYHQYSIDETDMFERVAALNALCKSYNPDLKLLQGESGSQSRSDGFGAWNHMAWTPEKQAKQLLRHGICDLLCNVFLTSYFSCVDMAELHSGTPGDEASFRDYGYFGILGADFDENGKASGTYTPKPSYYALCNISSVFAEDFEVTDLPIISTPLDGWRYGPDSRDINDNTVVKAGFKRADGSVAYCYYTAANLLTSTYDGSYTITCANMPKDVKLLNLMDSGIYKIPDNMIVKISDNSYRIEHLPIKDYPLILDFGGFYKE